MRFFTTIALSLVLSQVARAEMLLVGTITAGDASVATVRAGGEVVSLRLGESAGGWTLERVDYGLAIVRAGNVKRELRSGDYVSDEGYFERGIAVSGDDIVMSRGVHDQIAGEGLMGVIMEATATPVYDIYGLSGFRVWNFDVGSVYDLVGLRNGDIVTEIDGEKLVSVLGSIALLRSVQFKRSFSVGLERAGVRRTVTVTVRD